MFVKPYRAAYLQLALDEVLVIEQYLELQRAGFGVVFRAELKDRLALLTKYDVMPVIAGSRNIRQMPLTRFPYSIFYQLTDDLLLVLAVGRTTQKPPYWKDG